MIRLLDIIIALIGIALVFIPCAVIAVILRFTGEGHIFYLQERIGKNGKPFQIYKFATMLKDSPNMAGGDITTGGDPRILPLGNFLRKTKINELPQFLNVLGGSISVVGPRPITPNQFAMFPDEYQNILNHIPPGITGVASIVFRDQEDVLSASNKDPLTCMKEDIMPYKTILELWYLEHRSLWINLVLIFLTAWTIIFPRSALYKKLLPNLPKTPALSR